MCVIGCRNDSVTQCDGMNVVMADRMIGAKLSEPVCWGERR